MDGLPEVAYRVMTAERPQRQVLAIRSRAMIASSGSRASSNDESNQAKEQEVGDVEDQDAKLVKKVRFAEDGNESMIEQDVEMEETAGGAKISPE